MTDWHDILAAAQARQDQSLAAIRDSEEIAVALQAYTQAFLALMVAFQRAGVSTDDALGFIGGGFAGLCARVGRVSDA